MRAMGMARERALRCFHGVRRSLSVVDRLLPLGISLLPHILLPPAPASRPSPSPLSLALLSVAYPLRLPRRLRPPTLRALLRRSSRPRARLRPRRSRSRERDPARPWTAPAPAPPSR